MKEGAKNIQGVRFCFGGIHLKFSASRRDSKGMLLLKGGMGWA